MKTVPYILFVLICLTSFTTDKKFTLTTKPDETILIGKFDIYNKGQLKNKDISFQLRNIQTGSKRKVKLDDEGYFIAKVPAGLYEIKQVYYLNAYINLPHGYLTFEASDPQAIFYIGNVYINWSPLHYNRAQSAYFMVAYYGNPLGALVTATLSAVGNVAIQAVQDKNVDLMPAIVREKEKTIERFSSFYPENTKDIISQPVNIYIYEN